MPTVPTDVQPRLLVEERRRKILALLEEHERVTVSELADRFGVSAVTIRGDLQALHDVGVLVRAHGGAVRRLETAPEVPVVVKRALNHAEKARIGASAAALIHDGDTVILDSGTTTVEVARQIRLLDLTALTVITNALNVALELARLPQVRVIMLGGMVRPASHSMVGPQAERALRELNADRLFLGVDGLDPDSGLTTHDVLEAQLNGLMIDVAREVIVVADSSKFMARSLSTIAPLERIHKVVTEIAPPAPLADALAARGVEVIIA